ncbi:hypothetical protein FE784_19890 [Paenibacillus hemerocallicola]|uniref:Phage tail tape measure protein n=1 Tax=Paenibacillus hemerocallicola TaxID=1172614 RepID=A0A5C4T634_9BACL|nr:tape measure protein [Paenibacillus hemerocallicola]TNJ64541.1 hypothetical protein FE784_19890 [Paenibacillus hemerocallicola]
MAKEFTMGAKMTLKDHFSSTIKRVKQSTEAFAKSADLTRDKNGRLRDSLGRFAATAEQSKRSLVSFSGGLSSMGAAASGARMHISGLAGAVTALAVGVGAKMGFDWLIGANADMEQYQNTLGVVLKSQEKAVETLAWAQKFAAKTPFEIPQIVEATTRMSAYGLEAKKVMGITGDMAAVMGKDLMQAVEAVADAQTGELERLKEFGITKKMVEDQAKLLGTSPIDKSGSIRDMRAFNAALFSLMEDRFRGGMEMQSKTFKGMVSNVKDFMGTMGRQLGKPLFEKAKARLGIFLDTLNRLQADGNIDRWIGNVQKGAAVVGAGFGKVAGVVRQSWAQLRGFYTENQGKLAKIGAVFVAAFSSAIPVISWLFNTGLPMVNSWLYKIAGWVMDTAVYFVDNWGWIDPIVTGLAISFGTYYAVLKTVAAYTKIATAVQTAYNAFLVGGSVAAKAVAAAQAAYSAAMVRGTAVTRVLAAAQAFFNVVLMANPIGLVVAAIGLLIGAGILLYKNWDKVTEYAGKLWEGMKAVWGAMTSWVTNKITEAKEWGANIIMTMVDGILGAKDKLVDGVKSVFKKVRELMPFSDAKRGPFSELTYSGGALMTTLGQGVDKKAAQLKKSVTSAFQDTGLGVNIAPGKVESLAPAPAAASPAAAPQVTIHVGGIEINGADGDTERMANELIEVIYRKAKDAAQILSSVDKSALIG